MKLSQREIYDRRYAEDGYDTRSVVSVLTAEAVALGSAAERATQANLGAGALSLLDYGYGTGRVTNEFALAYPYSPEAREDLRVTAYDVSRVGLRKAIQRLKLEGFVPEKSEEQTPSCSRKLASLRKPINNTVVTFNFILGDEEAPPAAVQATLLEANNSEPYTITSSWYGSVSHTAGLLARQSLFKMLGSATAPDGEMVISVSSTGDLQEDQEIWASRLQQGDTQGFPIEMAGDVMYETEISGLMNYYHLFGIDFMDCMQQTLTHPDQACWVEAVRFPDEEFMTKAEEEANYKKVVRFNESKRGMVWEALDYSKLHTVVGFRSMQVRRL